MGVCGLDARASVEDLPPRFASLAISPFQGKERAITSGTPGNRMSSGPRAPLRFTARGRISAFVLATHARPSYANAISKIVPRSRIASNLRRRWDRLPAFAKLASAGEGRSARSCSTNNRKRNADRRIGPSSAPYGRGSRSAERARLSAFHHGACCSEPTPQLSSRTRFLGRGGKRALPAPAYPSPATKSQTGHHAGRASSEAARERR